MTAPLKYIVDDSGNKTTVLVPVKVWDDLNSNYRKLQSKLDILSGLRDGLAEVSKSNTSSKKLQTLKAFLK